MLQVGIVGLANVGKSTLFNALLRRQQAYVANYPFATVEPNIGIVPVPDARLDKLADVIARGERDPSTPSTPLRLRSVQALRTSPLGIRPPIVPATVQFVDIAGLVKGAAQGAGLGNKFLSHIREVDLIAQVVRAFPDEEIIREGSVDPKSDIETVNTELILADLQTVQSQKLKVKSQNSNLKFKSGVEKLEKELDRGKLARDVELTEEEIEEVSGLQLLTTKGMIYVLNVNTTTDWQEALRIKEQLAVSREQLGQVCVIDAKLEAELSQFNPDEQQEYLESLGISESGVDQFIRLAYETLGLVSFLTAGEKEVRAWTLRRGSTALRAAGTIHTDFEKGFIKAEVVDFEDFIRYNGWTRARENGKVRVEGKDYVVKDGDVIEFKVNPA